jgi:hypothetical protein
MVDKKINAFYDNEHHAGHQYNLWCEEYNVHTSNLNIIDKNELNEFQEHIKKERNLPTNIQLVGDRYKVRIKSQHIGVYDTLLEAILSKTLRLQKLEELKQRKILSKPIKRNEDGIAIIEIFNNKKEKVAETMVDDEIYYDLMKCKWCLQNKTYVQNGKLGLLHRYILNYTGNDFIDHHNGNPLDNRKSNLRIATIQENNRNTIIKPNETSQYRGVRKYYNKWTATITNNYVKTSLGSFDTEEEAAKARDEATKNIFKGFGKLNFKE